MAGEWGGARAGAGRKPADYKPPEYPVDPEKPDGETLSFDRERAMHERVKREEREHKLAVARGEYLPRVVVQQASATALAVLTQSLRGIPDLLERSCNLTPGQAEAAQQTVDAALAEVAKAFEQLAAEGS